MRNVLFLLAIGCGDDSGDSKMIDAPGQTGDSGNVACTGAIYDPCTDNAQCNSQICRLFVNDNIQMCTQMCTPGEACPMAGATAVTCNNLGFCKAPAVTNCMR